MANPRSISTANTYQYYFKKVLDKRLYFVFYNINLLLAAVTSITLAIPYDDFWFNVFLTFVLRAPIIWLALASIKQARYKFSTVEFSTHKTLASQISHTLFSFKFINYTVFYMVSAYLISGVFIMQLPFKYNYYLLSKEYRQKPLINDEWLFYWVFPAILATIYSLIHLIFQRNRLVFEIGCIRNDPTKSLISKFPSLIGVSIFQNTLISFIAPLIYWILKPFIFKLNFLLFLIVGLDTSIPRFQVSLSTFLSISFLSFHIIQIWEITNHAYNVYATVGCLDYNKPISTYSSDPITTLLSGLRNVDPYYQLSRLTAFQELAYISSSGDSEARKLRDIIYNSRGTKGIAWPAILEECSLIINDFTAKVNFRSSSDLKAMKDNSAIEAELKILTEGTGTENHGLFGNSTANTSSEQKLRQKLKDYVEPKINTKPSLLRKYVLNNSFVVSLSNAVTIDMNKYQKLIRSWTPRMFHDVIDTYNSYTARFLSTDLGVLFRITVKRDSESRVVNHINYSNAVLALSKLAINSIDEDKNFTITEDNISYLLNLLEGPIRAAGNYTDFLPASIYLTPEQRANPPKNHVIVSLHDLTMTEFYNLCIKFNYKLNNLTLNPKTFRLAKKVIDIAVAEQEQQPLPDAKLNIYL